MGIFTNKAIATESEIEFELREGFEYGMNAHYDIFMESLDDDMLILESMYAYDMAEIEQSRIVAEAAEKGEDEEKAAKEEKSKVMEASSKEVFTKIKTAVQKFFTSVLSWFEGVINRVRAIAMNGEDFEKKFGAKVKEAKMSEPINVEGYKFDVAHLFDSKVVSDFKSLSRDNFDINVGVYFSGRYNSNEKLTQAEDNIKKSKYFEVYGAIAYALDIDINNASDADEALFNYFYGSGAKKDGKKKMAITKSMVLEYLGNLAKSTSMLKDLQKAKAVTKTEASAIIRNIDKAANEAKNENENDGLESRRMAVVRLVIQYVKNLQTANIRIINSWSSALGAYVNFAKSICLSAMRSK